MALFRSLLHTEYYNFFSTFKKQQKKGTMHHVTGFIVGFCVMFTITRLIRDFIIKHN